MASQKRLLTAPNSKLSTTDLVALLRQHDAWALLPKETREHLYSLLPEPKDGEPPHDPDVHPLNTSYKQHIEGELRRFQDDLKDGREQKKWREDAMQAGKDRVEGKFDEAKELQRKEYWGKAGVENVKPNGQSGGDGDDHVEENKMEIEDSDEEGKAFL